MNKGQRDNAGNRNTLGCALIRMSTNIDGFSERDLRQTLPYIPAYILADSKLYYFNDHHLTKINVWSNTFSDLDSLFPDVREGYRFATPQDLSSISYLVNHQHKLPSLSLVESVVDLEQSLASVCVDLMFHKKNKTLKAVEMFRYQLNKVLHDFDHGVRGDKADPYQYLAYRCKNIFAEKEGNKELMADSSAWNQLLVKLNLVAKQSIVATNDNFKEKFTAAKNQAKQSLAEDDSVENPTNQSP